MPAVYRLQELKTVNATGAQELQETIDVLQMKTLTFACRVPVAAGTSGTLTIETAAVLDDDAFIPTLTTFDLTEAKAIATLESPLRFIRWNVTGLVGGPVTFQVDAVGRET